MFVEVRPVTGGLKFCQQFFLISEILSFCNAITRQNVRLDTNGMPFDILMK